MSFLILDLNVLDYVLVHYRTTTVFVTVTWNKSVRHLYFPRKFHFDLDKLTFLRNCSGPAFISKSSLGRGSSLNLKKTLGTSGVCILIYLKSRVFWNLNWPRSYKSTWPVNECWPVIIFTDYSFCCTKFKLRLFWILPRKAQFGIMILECVSSVILVDGKVNADVMIHALVLSLFPRVLNVSSIEKYTFWFLLFLPRL